MLTTHETFDIITSDPIHPWVKGAATLYTREYFEMVKRHLNPGGVVSQWVPLYESEPDVVKSEIATFFEVFPNGTIWGNTNNGEGYDIVLLGQAGPTTIDPATVERRLRRPVVRRGRRIAARGRLRSARSICCPPTPGRPRTWRRGCAARAINRDRNLRLQYLAGLGLNWYQSGTIYSDMLEYRRFPDEIFVGMGPLTRELWDALGRPPSMQ